MSPSPEPMEDGRPARPAEPRPSTPTNAAVPEFSVEERRLLLDLARQSIASTFDGGEVLPGSPSPHLSEPHLKGHHLNDPRGAFTTIYVNGRLHGCVGYVMPIAPLYRTVAETARAAAFDDPRFPPLTRLEFAGLSISLSVLSVPEEIIPDQIQLGRHGLLITQGAHRGLLLPQVPIEHGWDRMTFLEQTCRKAGLPADAWKTAKIEAFVAEVFGESDLNQDT